MNLVDYHKFVRSRTKDDGHILDDLDPLKARLWHLGLALLIEADGLCNALKAHCIYDKALDIENIVEELGDIEFYLAAIYNELYICREECLSDNVEKLRKRYPDGFTNQAAQGRADKKD